MKCAVLWCIFVALISRGQSFDFNDLKNLNGSCHARGTCVTTRGSRLDAVTDWKEVNCFCDDSCSEYGDCCLEAKSLDAAKMKNSRTKYECVDIEPFGSYYMKGKCMEGWESREIADLCGKASPESSTFHDDPFLDMPVTSLHSGVTYKNFYCASCNNESIDDLEVWHARLSCPETIDVTDTRLQDHLQFVNESWGLYQNNSNGTGKQFFSCDIFPTVKETVFHKIRYCKNYISECSYNWTDPDVEDLCQSYTTLVFGPPPESTNGEVNPASASNSPYGSTAYRNYHCAVCNHIKQSDLSCYERNFRKVYSFVPVSFSVLFDFGVKLTDCERGEIWDPFSKTCRPVVCVKANSEFRGGRCVKVFDNISSEVSSEPSIVIEDNNDTAQTASSQLKCDKLFLNESDFARVENGSIKVNIFRRTYEVDEYEAYKEGILVCIPNHYSRLMGWLTLLGIGLSCLCIIIHLITFFFVPDLRNLSGKNLACMCLALLIAYICFLIVSMKEHGTNSCPILASAMYYFFLASFSWMNVMAFDIWRTLQMATSELRLTTGKQWKKFIYYSVYAWSLPLVSLTFVLMVDYLKPSWIDYSYLPELGKRLCWFGQRKAILVYFAAPLALIMLLNVFFFIMAVKMVAITAQTTATLSSSQPHQTQLKLYLRLALLMGLSWITGIIAGYIQQEYVWYLFILLNAFQGLFILIGFTCTKKVFRALKGTNSFRYYSNKKQNKNYSTSRQALESQDSNHSHLSNTSSTNISGLTSKSSILIKSP